MTPDQTLTRIRYENALARLYLEAQRLARIAQREVAQCLR